MTLNVKTCVVQRSQSKTNFQPVEYQQTLQFKNIESNCTKVQAHPKSFKSYITSKVNIGFPTFSWNGGKYLPVDQILLWLVKGKCFHWLKKYHVSLLGSPWEARSRTAFIFIFYWTHHVSRSIRPTFREIKDCRTLESSENPVDILMDS